MEASRDTTRSRLRWAILFALLLLALAAVPVLAAEPVPAGSSESTDFTPPTPEEEEIAAAQVPGPEEVSKAIGEYEREERAHEAWLATPEATLQREQSRRTYTGLSATESQELLRRAFPQELEALNSDPSRYLSDARLVATLGASGAVVKDGSESSLLETTVPLRTEDEEGKLAKVDLSLESTASGFETDNAVADLRLPDSADESIEVGEEGVEISQQGAAATAAHRFGDKNLFYPSVLPDTDLMASATSFGAELYDLLRSEDSPEDLRFHIAVPRGVELRSDGRGGAEVLRDGKRLTLIPKPSAKDAQGTDVPLQSEVEGGSLVVHVHHHADDYAYPILVDPIVEDWVNQGQNWYGGNNWGALSNGAWQWTSNNSSIHHEICCWEGSHAGLLTIVEPVFYGPEQYGQWSYSTANEHVYIPHIWLIPFNRADNGCGSQQPHDYAGLWNPESELWSPIWINYAKTYGNLAGDGVGRALVIGEGTGPPGVWLACQRVLYSGGVGIWLEDAYPPIIFGVNGLPPNEWISDEDHLHIEVVTGDEGLGVHHVGVNLDGAEVINDEVGYCTGLYGNRCPNDYTAPFNLTGASFRQGIRTNGVSAEDPTGKAVSSQFTSQVDYSPPEVELKGQLARETNTEVGLGEPQPEQHQGEEGEDELSLPVYHLNIRATDGSTESDLTKQSGMRNIKLYLDGKELKAPWTEQQCPQSSCEMEKNYPLALTGLEAGVHKLVVEAIDWVDKKRLREIEFEYIPATGIKDEYIMQYFPLPDGQGNEEDEEHPVRPELAVNVMNGNLVYRQRDVKVQGPSVNLEVERFYNAQLPSSEDTEWGDGWTLAQTPKLEPEFQEEAPPTKGSMVQNSGAITNAVGLPPESGGEHFDPKLQAMITKETGGGYSVKDESGETEDSLVFNSNGKVTEERTPGYAKVDYGYEEGKLSEIAVEDPGSAGGPNEPPEGEGEFEEIEEEGETPTYADSFGSYGSENGQLKSPGDVAIDAQGDVWVADKGNNRIEHFDSEGNFISKFGTAGSGNGQLSIPTSLAIDAQGDIWVTERGNNRVQEFSPTGEYLAKFGSYGTGNGQFCGPEGIAIDAQGNVWVADTYNGRVQEFNSEGTFLRVVGSHGSGEGQIGEPTGIDVDAEGDVWTADWQNNRVEEFSTNGEFIRQFGSAGNGDGQFNRPDALDIDAQGNVWVGDQNNGRVQRFDLEGSYMDQFGSQGSDEGQFSFTYPMGLEADAKGDIWIADVNNNRIQKWTIPGSVELFTAYADSLGSSGSEPGQLKAPADAALDAEGGLWVADRGNNRIVHFDPEGHFASQFGSAGSGDGQLNAPSGIDIDPEGNVWVADTGNDRIEKFNPQGEFLLKFGSHGSEGGQFDEPVGIAYAPGLPAGAVYVADRGNNRIELFGKGGNFIGQAGAYGSGEKQLIEPSAIALGGPYGESPVTLLIADSGNHRIQRWKWAGGFVNQFGTLGTGKGQFDHPEAIDVDEQGTIWVGDRVNDRVEAFDEEGNSLGEFGGAGTGVGQLELAHPIGIVASDGEVFIADSANDRIDRWYGFMDSLGGELQSVPEDDPKVEVTTTAGLVSSVSGEKAGQHSYSHEGDDLTAYSGPEGETAYEYDAAGRMTKVSLPNGTWGEIAYFEDGRVKSVTVSVEGGQAKKTTFSYEDEPERRTTVIPPDAPHVIYHIGEDGSVFKWWNVQKPPTIDYIAGTLGDVENRETADPISVGEHRLDVQAHSEEGIASIKVIVNNTDLVDELSCNAAEELEECLTVVDEWVMETESFPPGRFYIEVLVTDRLGESTSERYWVNIPPPPPPPAPGTPIPPKFKDVAKFREEYGLEKVFPVKNEIELNERIFNLIKAWHEPDTPAGQVARGSMERWGVPLRPADVAEMEYREWYMAVNIPIIEEWAESHRTTTYAGYYLDHPAGGILHIGFTEDQTGTLEELEQDEPLVAQERLAVYPTPPTVSRASLSSVLADVEDAWSSDPTLENLVNSAGVDERTDTVEVTGTDLPEITSRLEAALGPNPPIRLLYEEEGESFDGRNHIDGRIHAGDRIIGSDPSGSLVASGCTAGFGAWDKTGVKPNGEPEIAAFLLTAGHCARPGYRFYRTAVGGPVNTNTWKKFGHTARTGLPLGGQHYETDGSAIRLNAGGLMPYYIFKNGESLKPVGPAGRAHHGETLCFSGAGTNEAKRCGEFIGVRVRRPGTPGRQLFLITRFAGVGGDSGAPVWSPRMQRAIGLVSGGPHRPGLVKDWVTPLLVPRGQDAGKVPGILNAPGMGSLHLAVPGS